MKKLKSIIVFLILSSVIGAITLMTFYHFYPQQTKKALYKGVIIACSILGKTEPYKENKYGVHPLLYTKVEAMLLDLRKEGINVKVIRGFRTLEEQKRLYAQGRTTKGAIVTYAIPGLSYHNYGWAVDVVVYENGRPNWNNNHWQKIGKIGKSKGLVWGGDWKKLVDRPHFQLSMKDVIFGE